jgi:hypothetical protein
MFRGPRARRPLSTRTELAEVVEKGIGDAALFGSRSTARKLSHYSATPVHSKVGMQRLEVASGPAGSR